MTAATATTTQSTTETKSPWLLSPAADVGLIAFGWVPFYLLYAYGLHLAEPGAPMLLRPGFRTALLIVLSLIFAHRQYVFLVVYADREAFLRRTASYLAWPLILFAAVGAAWLGQTRAPWGWSAVLALATAWNIWHTIMQRHGLMRAYAVRAGGGLESRAQGRRDLAFVWSAVALLALVLLRFRGETLAYHPVSQEIATRLSPILRGPVMTTALAVASLAALASLFASARGELSATAPMGARAPRLILLASTLTLFGVFVAHGPILGYLAFATAHALEYGAFVHAFGARRYQASGQATLLHWLFARAPELGLFLALALVMAQGALRLSGITLLGAYVVYDNASAFLHFLYDGWVWKMRKPDIASAVARG